MPNKPKYDAKAASRARATARAKARTRQQLMNPRMVEAGVGNIPASLARLGVAVAKTVSKGSKSSKPAPKPTRVPGQTKKGINPATGSVKPSTGRGSKSPMGPSRPKLSPQQKAAQTRKMNQWKAEQAAAKKAAAKKTRTQEAAKAKNKVMTGKKGKAAAVYGGTGLASLYFTSKMGQKK